MTGSFFFSLSQITKHRTKKERHARTHNPHTHTHVHNPTFKNAGANGPLASIESKAPRTVNGAAPPPAVALYL